MASAGAIRPPVDGVPHPDEDPRTADGGRVTGERRPDGPEIVTRQGVKSPERLLLFDGDPAYRSISAAESEIHGEPHIEGCRITVRDVHARVEQRGLAPERMAERYDLDIANVYEALAYFHNNPAEMRRVEKRHTRAAADARDRSSLAPPEN